MAPQPTTPSRQTESVAHLDVCIWLVLGFAIGCTSQATCWTEVCVIAKIWVPMVYKIGEERRMQPKIMMAILVGLFMALPAHAALGDGSVRAKIGVSQNNFDTLWSGGVLEADYTSLNVGLTYISQDQWYLDLGYKTDTSADWNTAELLPVSQDEDYERDDITITVGKIINGVQLFVGYQNSKTDMALPLITQQIFGWVAEEEFNIKGYFAGLGRSFSIGEGSLNINGSMGWMDAELVDASGFSNDASGGDGYSVGASYTYFFGSKTSVSAELKHQNYSYEYSNQNIILTAGDDQMTMFGININRQF